MITTLFFPILLAGPALSTVIGERQLLPPPTLPSCEVDWVNCDGGMGLVGRDFLPGSAHDTSSIELTYTTLMGTPIIASSAPTSLSVSPTVPSMTTVTPTGKVIARGMSNCTHNSNSTRHHNATASSHCKCTHQNTSTAIPSNSVLRPTGMKTIKRSNSTSANNTTTGQLQPCGDAMYSPSSYTCYGTTLCPIVNGEATIFCDSTKGTGSCYLPTSYFCTNGTLFPQGNASSAASNPTSSKTSAAMVSTAHPLPATRPLSDASPTANASTPHSTAPSLTFPIKRADPTINMPPPIGPATRSTLISAGAITVIIVALVPTIIVITMLAIHGWKSYRERRRGTIVDLPMPRFGAAAAAGSEDAVEPGHTGRVMGGSHDHPGMARDIADGISNRDRSPRAGWMRV